MDLGTIGDILADFATFGKNIGTALQNLPGVIGIVSSLVDGGLSSIGEAAGDGASSIVDAATDFGSSN